MQNTLSFYNLITFSYYNQPTPGGVGPNIVTYNHTNTKILLSTGVRSDRRPQDEDQG